MSKEKINNLLKGSFVIIFYLIMQQLTTLPLDILNINYNTLNIKIKSIYLIVYETFITLSIILIYKQELIIDFKEFFKTKIKSFKKYIRYWLIILILMVLSNFIVTLFTSTNISNNQKSILELFKIVPIYTIYVTVITAPILEELVFRLSFKKIINNKIIYILLSGLVFGSLHVIGSFNTIADLLFIIPYSIPGFIFGYIYVKEENIFVPISIHFIHNGFMMLLQIIL